MQSLLSGSLYDKLSKFRQISWYFSSVILTTTISALWSTCVTRENQLPELCACCRNINFHGELEMQIMCLDSLCKSLLCSHLYRTLRKAKESETRGKKGKNKEKGEKTGSIFCPLWYPVLIENKFFWVSCIIILIKENIFWQGSKN